MRLANPRLSELITAGLGGDGWLTDLDRLTGLEPLADDPAFRERWRAVKRHNKVDLAAYTARTTGVVIDPDALCDVMIKRFHEYKRQLLKVLHVITLYNRIQDGLGAAGVPRTVIFGGKAAPGYRAAKQIMRLINAVADAVNTDPAVSPSPQVVFLPNYNVTLAELIIPAADLSEQISLAGKEASGTGNMKLALNGAVTIGTLDGANIEIRDRVGADNFFLFGLDADAGGGDAAARDYPPRSYYEADPELRVGHRRDRRRAPSPTATGRLRRHRGLAARPGRVPVPGRLPVLCGLPGRRRDRLAGRRPVDADVDPEHRPVRLLLLRPHGSRLLPRHLARRPGTTPLTFQRGAGTLLAPFRQMAWKGLRHMSDETGAFAQRVLADGTACGPVECTCGRVSRSFWPDDVARRPLVRSVLTVGERRRRRSHDHVEFVSLGQQQIDGIMEPGRLPVTRRRDRGCRTCR